MSSNSNQLLPFQVSSRHDLADLVDKFVTITSELVSRDGPDITLKILGTDKEYIGRLSKDGKEDGVKCRYYEAIGVVTGEKTVEIYALIHIANSFTDSGAMMRYRMVKSITRGMWFPFNSLP